MLILKLKRIKPTKTIPKLLLNRWIKMCTNDKIRDYLMNSINQSIWLFVSPHNCTIQYSEYSTL